MNIVEPIIFQCKLNPLALAICVPGSNHGAVTYSTLERHIYSVSRSAIKSGIAPGDIVAIYTNDIVLHTALALGLMYMGAATLSLKGPEQVPGITPDVVLTDTPGRISGGVTVLGVDQSWLEYAGGVADRSAPYASESDTCRIILTSGSTGVSKGVAFSHRALADRITYYMYSKGPRFAHCPRFFCDLGLSTSPGFGYVMAILGRGAAIYFLGPEPADILQIIGLHKIQGMATSPYGLGEFLRYFERDSAFDLTFDHIICQGAKLSPELSRRARARMCQNLYSSFGSTETSTVAFGPTNALARTPGAVGFIQPGVVVEALDNEGRLQPPGRDGVLRIRTEHLAAGYVCDPEATQKFFRDGYFYSGDIGHVTTDGLLVITGRDKSALNLGGETVTPESVEEVIASFEGVREAGVFAVINDIGNAELSALVVTNGAFNDGALRQHCSMRLPASCVPGKFIVVDALPRGGQGKLERARLPEVAAANAKAG
jgi:acyl-CoA synthetase (AMP-forming)/AMP-acid ligase II